MFFSLPMLFTFSSICKLTVHLETNDLIKLLRIATLVHSGTSFQCIAILGSVEINVEELVERCIVTLKRQDYNDRMCCFGL